MYLIIIIAQDEDTPELIDSLNTIGIRTTKIASLGGFLKNGNSTLLAAIEKSRINEIIEVIKHTCKSRKKYLPSSLLPDDYTAAHVNNIIEVGIGKASIFVAKLEDFIKL